jgi:hypothetical protein
MNSSPACEYDPGLRRNPEQHRFEHLVADREQLDIHSGVSPYDSSLTGPQKTPALDREIEELKDR